MDEIVKRVNKLNFHVACVDSFKENFELNVTSVVTDSFVMDTEKVNVNSSFETDVCPSTIPAICDAPDDEVLDNNGEDKPDSKESVSNRRLPMRNAKVNGLLKLKNRVISKPMKRTQKVPAMGAVDILKMYMGQKLTKFRPSPLETIFEEPEGATAEAESSNSTGTEKAPLRLLGLRRVRRTILLSNGLNPNKSVVKQRRAKIKKHFGRRNVLGKYPLEDFITLMRKNLIDNCNDEDQEQTSELTTDLAEIKGSEEIEMEDESMNIRT